MSEKGKQLYYKRMSTNYRKDAAKAIEKYNRLKDLDVFVLDNSVVESTVGQLRSHTLEDKWHIYEQAKKCGFKHIIVAAFDHMNRVDDVFIKQLVDRGEDRECLWAFSEITDHITQKIPDTETVPIGLRKLQEVGLYNVIFEIDVGNTKYDFSKFKVEQFCELIKKWVVWVHDNLDKHLKVCINIRDLADAMPEDSDRVFYVIDFLCKLQKDVGLFGIMFVEPSGSSLPEECGMWATYIRQIMDDHEWNGHLLVHVHEQYGYSDATVMEVLMSGANGIWASVCMEGAIIGHASSCVTLLNLIRLGNKEVLKKFNCTYLRQAAINVTKITTGAEPHIQQPIYGGRALDFVFNMPPDKFDLAGFFLQKSPVRITILSTPAMIVSRLKDLFGEHDQFTEEFAYKMKEVMHENLKSNRKEEYMSKVGMAVLFHRAGGSLNGAIRDAIAHDHLQTPHAQNLIAALRKRWNECGNKKDELEFNQFYDGFMSPYFGCHRCNDTLKAWAAIDMDKDGQVDWNEFMLYVKWALQQYHDEINDTDELLDIAFKKGIIPAMRDELFKQEHQCEN